MKLISEFHDQNLEVLTEEKNGKKSFVIQGIFAQAESKNRNGRIYEKAIMEKAIGKYTGEQVSKGRAVGELNHPEGPTVNLDKVSHKIEDLNFEGNDVMGKATVLDTPMGKVVEGLLDGGVNRNSANISWFPGGAETDEPTGARKVDFLSNGFKVMADAASINGAADTYIYMAWGDIPSKYSPGFGFVGTEE